MKARCAWRLLATSSFIQPLLPHLESSEVKSEEIKHYVGKQGGKEKNAVWLPMIWGTESISCFDMQKQKKGIKKSLPSKECLFAVGLYFFLDRRFMTGISLQCETKLQDSLKARQLEMI